MASETGTPGAGDDLPRVLIRAAQLVLLLAAASCSPGAAATRAQAPAQRPVTRPFPDDWRYLPTARVTFAPRAMVASSNRLAAEAALEILRAGGNAIDAAVALGFALAVTYPEAGNIGGGGYMVIRLASGETLALDYREAAPSAASRDMYLDSSGTLTQAGVIGRAASGVPAVVAGLTTAHARHGRLPLRRVLEPAIRLAANGFVVDSTFERSVAGKQSLIARFSGAQLFLPGGRPPRPGTLFVQTDLARTLTRVAERGAAGFYGGETAALLLRELARECPAGVAPRYRAAAGCGIMTAADLESYRAVWRTPVKTSFRGHTIISMPPSSSGGITLGETLNILDGFPRLPRFGSPEHVHLLTAAFQRAFLDRNSLLGDADFVRVPAARLLSRAYADSVRRGIDLEKATPTVSLASGREGTETTHYSVVDAFGNAVSTTTTINSLFGSGVFVTGAGFFLNNTMDDFASRPGMQNQFGLVQGEANAIAPGKRGLSAMTPSIVLDPRGGVLLVLGARGGPRIITSVAQVVLNVIEHGMTLSDAVAAPRIHYQSLPDTVRYDAGGLDSAVVARLRRMGHALTPQSYIGGSVVAIRRVRGGYEGMDDPRGSGGGAVGY